MRAIKLFVIAAFLVVAALQTLAMPQAKPTEVKGHLMGESFADFIAKENMPDTVTPCRQIIQNYKPREAKHCDHDLPSWKFLECLHGTPEESAEWDRREREYRKCSERVKGDVVTIEVPSFGDPGLVALPADIDVGHGGEAKFRDGKLVEATLKIWFSHMLPTEVIKHLSDKYGEPRKRGAVEVRGERLQVGFWTMPDETEIFAIQGGPLHPESTVTEVTFTAKSEAERARRESQTPKKNPFEK